MRNDLAPPHSHGTRLSKLEGLREHIRFSQFLADVRFGLLAPEVFRNQCVVSEVIMNNALPASYFNGSIDAPKLRIFSLATGAFEIHVETSDHFFRRIGTYRAIKMFDPVRRCIDHTVDVTAMQLRPIGTTLTVTQLLGFEDELRARFLGPSLPPEFCAGNLW